MPDILSGAAQDLVAKLLQRDQGKRANADTLDGHEFFQQLRVPVLPATSTETTTAVPAPTVGSLVVPAARPATFQALLPGAASLTIPVEMQNSSQKSLQPVMRATPGNDRILTTPRVPPPEVVVVTASQSPIRNPKRNPNADTKMRSPTPLQPSAMHVVGASGRAARSWSPERSRVRCSTPQKTMPMALPSGGTVGGTVLLPARVSQAPRQAATPQAGRIVQAQASQALQAQASQARQGAPSLAGRYIRQAPQSFHVGRAAAPAAAPPCFYPYPGPDRKNVRVARTAGA